MLTFLRKIRRFIIETGSTQKYLVYAIGEITLVVIGILIALQVNNWNESRRADQEVRIIKNNLRSEFIQNREVIEKRIDLLDQSLQHARTIIYYIDNNPKNLTEQEMDSVLVHTQYYGNFNPSNSTIEELLQAGGLKLLDDDSLKSMIFDWLQMLEDTDEDFKNQDLHAIQKLTPYLQNKISMRNIDLHGNYGVTESRSKLMKGYYDVILRDYKFENLMVDHMVWNRIMSGHYKELDTLALKILDRLK